MKLFVSSLSMPTKQYFCSQNYPLPGWGNSCRENNTYNLFQSFTSNAYKTKNHDLKYMKVSNVTWASSKLSGLRSFFLTQIWRFLINMVERFAFCIVYRMERLRLEAVFVVCGKIRLHGEEKRVRRLQFCWRLMLIASYSWNIWCEEKRNQLSQGSLENWFVDQTLQKVVMSSGTNIVIQNAGNWSGNCKFFWSRLTKLQAVLNIAAVFCNQLYSNT